MTSSRLPLWRFSFLATAAAGLFAACIGLANDARTHGRLEGIALPFIENTGQADPAVFSYAPTFAGTVYVTRDGLLVYSLAAKTGNTAWSLTESLVGGSPHPRLISPAATRVSSFLGSDTRRWRSDLAAYDAVSLGDAWPGIEVFLRAYGRNVEKLFTVSPGSDASRIRLRVGGASALRLDGSGALVVSTGLGDLRFTPPVAYQEHAGLRRPVEVAYLVAGNEYGFRLGVHDRTRPVVIDPLLQSTYAGGSGNDTVNQLAIHPTSGEVYAAGFTASANFPGTVGGAQPAYAGSTDAFVARYNAALTTLLQATYLGGSAGDTASSVAIHPTSGEVYVYGQTSSTTFPGTAGGTQSAIGGGQDAFVSRFNAALTTLMQSTFFGGTGNESASTAFAIHPTTGEVYCGGFTQGTDVPGTTGGAQPANAGFVDTFVTRLSATLTGPILQATYLGGSVADQAFSLAISAANGIYVTGTTNSADFPMTTGGAQPAIAPGFGNTDTFVSRLNAALTSHIQSTYHGGNGLDSSFGVAVHPTSGEIYTAGGTSSSDLPGTAGGAQPAIAGPTDNHVARFNSTLTSRLQATYRGGTAAEGADALAIHPTSGEVYITGITTSTDYPGVAGGAQPTFGGSSDIFISRFNAALTAPLNPATYLGGSQDDEAISMRIHPTSGEVYVGGYTLSNNYPGTTGGAQAVYGGGPTDGIVSRLTADLAGGVGTPTPTPTITFTPTPTLPGPTVTPTTTIAPGGPVNVPTLTPTVLALLALALAGIALYVLRRSS